jgi:hypothetical protein
MRIAILPYEGIDSARLGMTRAEVRLAIGGDVRQYKKGGSTEADQFLGKSIHAYYTDDDRCEAFEIYAPANVDFHGLQLLGRPFEDVLRALRALDRDIETDFSGACSVKLGVAVYAPFAVDAPAEPVEGVFVFKRGYWD